jgi:uncharacterized protein YhfF
VNVVQAISRQNLLLLFKKTQGCGSVAALETERKTMPKFYVQSGQVQVMLDAQDAEQAAIAAFQ